MRTLHVLAPFLAVVLFGVTNLGSSHAMSRDGNVCYQVIREGEPIGLFVRFNVKREGRLTTRTEEKSGHPRQTTYSVLGKSVSGFGGQPFIASIVDGAVVVARGEGARMGYTAIFQLRTDPDPVFRGVAHFECVTDEDSATPETWDLCEGQNINNNGAIFSGPSRKLVRVNPEEKTLCGFWGSFPAED